MRRFFRYASLGLAGLFALYGTIAVLLLASIMPPFMNPDEVAHFVRADQVAHGGLVARGGAAAPALIDANIIDVAARFAALIKTPALRVPRSFYAPANWGPRVTSAYPNTALYPPTLYLPAAVAIRIGQWMGLTVLPTLELARGAMGMASVLIGTLAIAVSGPAAIWLFAVLTLPMTLALMGALTQDGPMIALAAMAAAAWLRLQAMEAGRKPIWMTVMCVCLALIGMSRPPYVALAALPLLTPWMTRAWRWAGAAFVALMVGAWSAISLMQTRTDLMHYAGSSAGAQAAGLLRAPWRVVPVAWTTLAVHGPDYGRQFIGQLGWLDISLPGHYRLMAVAALTLAGLSAWRAGQGYWSQRQALLLGLVVAAAALLMFAIQYLTWTPVGATLVEGVQGRYFLPLALILGVVFVRPWWSGSRAALVGSCLVAVFPVVTIVVMLHVILLRYYL